MAPGTCRGGFGEFCGLANGSLARASGTCRSCRKGLPRPEWRLGAAGERLASFAGWQTAALNVLKRTLPGPAGKVLLRPEWRLGAAGEGLGQP